MEQTRRDQELLGDVSMSTGHGDLGVPEKYSNLELQKPPEFTHDPDENDEP